MKHSIICDVLKTQHLGGYEFIFVDFIRPKSDQRGMPVEYAFKIDAGAQNKHGQGPFCHFDVAEAHAEQGVYAITVDGKIVYIGQSKDLSFRFGPTGYGSIYAKNCEVGGQSTNCKVNGRILIESKAGRAIELWFHATSHRQHIEAELLQKFKPPWNKSLVPQSAQQTRGLSPVDFETRLPEALKRAEQSGRSYVDILSKDLHRAVGGYPGPKHRMPSCCDVMHAAMKAGDQILANPPKGKGASSLLIRYQLPR